MNEDSFWFIIMLVYLIVQLFGFKQISDYNENLPADASWSDYP